MSKINLRDIDPTYYTKDEEIEVSDEVAALFSDEKLEEDNYQRYLRRYGAFYSLDAGDGIEKKVLFLPRVPEEKIPPEVERLYEVIVALPDKQSIRICQHYFLDMSMTEIARIEGVALCTISKSIKQGIQKMKSIFWKSV